MATAPIGYGNDYAADQSQIERARQYAALMQQQSMEGSPTQVVNGWAVPQGKAVGLSKAIQGITGGLASYLADKKSTDLAAKQKLDLTNTLSDAQKAYMGTPASTTQPATPMDDEGNAMPAPQTAAVAGDPMKYASILMQNPQTQQMGMQAAQQGMQDQKRLSLLQQVLGGNAPQAPNGGPQTASGAMLGAGGAGGGAPTSQSNNTLGIPNKIAALLLSGDPEMAKLGTTILESSKGIAQRPGAPVVNPFTGAVIAQPTPAMAPGMQLNMSPQGNTAAQVPGYAQGAAGISAAQTGANAAAKLPFEPPSVINTPGAPTLMTPSQQIQAATGSPPPNPLGAQQPPQSPMQQAPMQPSAGMAGGPGASNRAGDRAQILQQELATEQARQPTDAADAQRKASNIAALQREMGASAPAPIERGPGGLGMKLQDQGESAQQVAGGKTLAQLQYEAPQARAAVADTVSNLNRLREQANQILNDKSLGGITGVQGMFPNMPGGHAADIQARLNTLKSQVGFGALQAMRAASKTGGALGSVSDSENDLLQRNIAALDKVQSLDGMKESLRKIIDYADGASQRMSRAYEDQYSRVQGTQGMKITPSGAMPANSSQGNIGWSIKRVGG